MQDTPRNSLHSDETKLRVHRYQKLRIPRTCMHVSAQILDQFLRLVFRYRPSIPTTIYDPFSDLASAA